MKLLSRLFGKKAEERGTVQRWSLSPWEARMRAGRMVRSAAGLGVELDYSPESLAKVDMLIDKERETGVGPTKEMVYVLVSLGAYAGEVMVRHLGGEWHRAAAAPLQDPLVMVVGDKYAVNVVSMVLRRFLAGEPHSVARMFEEAKKLRSP